MLKPLEQCHRCIRFKTQFRDLRTSHPDYWNKPVPCSGSSDAPLIIIGLAPGMHGANRTGVPFTGDASGNLLFATLEKLSLVDSVMITNAVKCLPISNKPNAREIDNCQAYLRRELLPLAGSKVILALGRIAHVAVLKVFELQLSHFTFAHGALHSIGDDCFLFDSFHCSRYNVQTKRLTPMMFEQVMSFAATIAGISLARRATSDKV